MAGHAQAQFQNTIDILTITQKQRHSKTVLHNQRDHQRKEGRGLPFFVFGKERFSFSGRRDRFYPAGSRASAASGQRSPESRSTYSHSRPPARLSFGGSLQHWLIAERLTPYLAAASRSVSNTSPVVMHLTFRLRRRSIALTEHFRQPEERDFAMRLYACADHTWPQALHSNVMRVWLLTYSVRGTISGCNRFNLSTNRSCVSFNLPAQLAHPEPRRRVVGATDHS